MDLHPGFEWIEIPAFGRSPRGVLEVLDSHGLPFPIHRVFWISQTERKAVRGQHGHFVGHEILIPLRGSLDVQMWTQGNPCVTVTLHSSSRGLWLKPGTFIEMKNFDPDTILLVLCSHAYKDDPVFHQKP